MQKKQTIDRKREAAGEIKICDANDNTPIRELLLISGNLHIITDKSIYLALLADDIDPKRTNIDVSNSHKKILEQGFENDIIGRILLLAKSLFDNKRLGEGFDCDNAISASFKATKLLIEMRDIFDQLNTDINSIIEKGLLPDTGRSQNIPTVNNLETHVTTYINKADLIRDTIIEIFKLAYSAGTNKKILENINSSIIAKHGEGSNLGLFFDYIRPTLDFTRNLRNAVEHPKEHERLIILDFKLTPEATVDPPTVEIVHPATPQPKTPITSFMEQMNSNLIDIMEHLILHLCMSNLGHFGKIECGIMELPPEMRKHKDTKFSHAIRLNDQWQPLS